jgi:Domain of unknown function (DUF5134)
VSGPAWPGYLLAVVMIVTAVYCVTRLAVAWLRRRPTAPDADVIHVVMGVVMAGMLVPRLSWLPDDAWEAVFGIALGWFGWQILRAYRGADSAGLTAHQAPHLLASGAMLYMFLAVSPARTGPAMAGVAVGGQSASTIRYPIFAVALALALFGYVVWITDRIPSLAPVSALRLAAAGAAVRPGPDWAAGASGAGASGAGASGAGASGRPRLPRDALPSPSSLPSRSAPLSPRLAACCEIVMCITMGYMLIVML